MSAPFLAMTGVSLLAALPLVVLTGVALLGRTVGEWGLGALLAYAAVLLAFICGGQANAQGGTPTAIIAGVGLFSAFVALALGSAPGLCLLAVAYGVLAALAMANVSALPLWLPILATLCSAVVAAATYLRG